MVSLSHGLYREHSLRWIVQEGYENAGHRVGSFWSHRSWTQEGWIGTMAASLTGDGNLTGWASICPRIKSQVMESFLPEQGMPMGFKPQTMRAR